MRENRNIYIIPSLGYGGAESFLLRLIPFMGKKNIIVTLYHTQFDKKRIRGTDVEYITLDLKRSTVKDYLKFIKLVFSLGINDTIFSWLYIADLLASLLKILFFWKKFNVIWNVRNTVISVHEYSLISYISYNILRSILRNIPKKIIFNSKVSYKQHIQKGYIEQKSTIIYNGFQRYSKIKEKKNSDDSFNIICVARYHQQKNHKLLFTSIQKFNQKYNCDFKLHLVGKGLNENNNKLVKNLIKLKIYEKTILYDLLDPIIVHDLLSICDIKLLLSSYGESFPNVIAEAMLYGTFPIATDIGDTQKIVSNFGDIISKNTSSEEISNIIYKYYLMKKNNLAIWKRKINECQQFASNRFGIEKSAKKYREVSNICQVL